MAAFFRQVGLSVETLPVESSGTTHLPRNPNVGLHPAADSTVGCADDAARLRSAAGIRRLLAVADGLDT